jgi:hypothetical protein
MNVQKRLIHESWLEQRATDELRKYESAGVASAVASCKSVLAKAWEEPIEPALKQRCEQLADDQPLEIQYDNLDPEAEYSIRVAYTGRFRSRMKMTADGIQVHDFIKTGVQPIYEFPIPAEALRDGSVTFSWTCGEAERGAQVSEIWIIRK